MTQKTTTTIYWISTILLCFWFGTSGVCELTGNPLVWGITRQLGYPPHFIYILGIAKVSGVITLLIPGKFLRLKEWVYAGITFDILFAFGSKLVVLGFAPTIDAIIAFAILTTSYLSFRKLYASYKLI
jgi:uncharacterized membrane protein YphA (DoxX/SURF4 family)